MFPEDLLNMLPPSGLSVAWKAIIYVSIIEIFLLSLVFSLVIKRKSLSSASFEEPVSITLKILGPNADRLDVITGLRVEIAGYQAALETLKNAMDRNEISERAYHALKSYYDLKVDEVKNSLTIYSDTTILDIDEELSQIELSDEGIASSDLNEIEGALSGLSIGGAPPITPPGAPPTSTSSASTRPTMPSPSAPPAPPAPPSPPGATPSVPPTAPKPPSPPAAPPSPPSAPVSAPRPPSSPSATPSAPPSTNIPSPPSPAPPKMGTEAPPPPPPPAETPESEDEGVFAKSTSIAALRMEMLKELAKLKKLSESMGEKE